MLDDQEESTQNTHESHNDLGPSQDRVSEWFPWRLPDWKKRPEPIADFVDTDSFGL